MNVNGTVLRSSQEHCLLDISHRDHPLSAQALPIFEGLQEASDQLWLRVTTASIYSDRTQLMHAALNNLAPLCV
jgi:hypothetical protein